MVTYKQYKNVLTYFYPKRKVLEDGRLTVPLDQKPLPTSRHLRTLYIV